MKRFARAICALSLALLTVFPAPFADGLFDALNMSSPPPTQEPASESGFFNLNGPTVGSDSQGLFAALQTPEPTPFPTPLPRSDAGGSKKDGDYTVLPLEDGTATIIAYKGKKASVSVPGTIKKLSVVAIGDSAFSGNEKLTEIELPEGLLSIGSWAFGSCPKLTKVTIPDGVKSIGAFAFADCPSLCVIRIPASVVEIGENLFERRSSGAELTIELESGSYAERYFEGSDYIIASYAPPVSSPAPAPELTPSPTQTKYDWLGEYDWHDEPDCPTCDGIGGCPNFCLWGEEICTGRYCSFGRCTECGGTGVKKSYDFHGGIKETQCKYCNGGKCKTCGGTGRIKCTVCNGTGRCPTCGK